MKLHEKIREIQTSEQVIEGVCCGNTTYDADDQAFADDDFYEAIDLLETCRQHINQVLKQVPVNPGRKHMLSNLSDDIKQFVDAFIVTPGGDDQGEV